jgi:hypothetical protein
MKKFTDKNGTFEIKVPITWRYSLKDRKIHTFQDYEVWKHDAFQISIHEFDNAEEKEKLITLSTKLKAIEIAGENVYCFKENIEEDFTVKAWIKFYDNKSVTFSLTHPTTPDVDLDNQPIDEKVKTTHAIIATFSLIEPSQSQDYINSYLFDMFLQGVGATALILSKAIENKAFFEATCILGNQIDALLRIAIVLKSQIINGDSKIESEWIYQGLTDKKKSEKDIYKKALELHIIDQDKLDLLYNLYDDRNRVIHRFIISDITLAEVEEIAFAYYQMQTSIGKLVYNIEAEQISLGVGMTLASENEQSEQSNLDYIKGKIGKLSYFDKK